MNADAGTLQPAQSALAETPVAAGLTSSAAAERLAQYGPNDPAPKKRRSTLLEFLRLFLNPLVLVLLIAATASAVLGEAADAGIIIENVV